MAILTQAGRAAMAASIKTQPIHLAWGNGNPDWEDYKSAEFAFADDQIDLGQTYIKELVVKSHDEKTTYIQGVDCNADSVTGLISRISSGSITSNETVLVSYVVDTPPEDISAGQLISEIGRRMANEVVFCVPDEQGDLVTPTGRFTASEQPTNNLHMRFNFDFEDSPGEIIRELGIMVNTALAENLPEGQKYFQGADITDPGILLVLEHTMPLLRTVATRETFSFVVTV